MAVGRPQIPFNEKSDFEKRRAASMLLTSVKYEANFLVHAAATAARKQGNLDMTAVLQKTLVSPTRPSKIRKLCDASYQKPIALTADEALAFLLENNFTKEQYNAIRRENKSRNCDITSITMKLHLQNQNVDPTM